jgi:hypothetical protein
LNPAAAVLGLAGLMFAYDGTRHLATVTSIPGGLSGVVVTYTNTRNNMPVTAPTQAGSYVVVASLVDPNYVAASVGGTLVINRATPFVTWPAPAAIAPGTPLGPAQLDATAPVPGTFAYTPGAGTVLPPGQGQRLLVTFTPADTTDYNSASTATTIAVGNPGGTSPLPQVVAITPVESRKGLTALTVSYNEPLVPASASDSLLYQVFGSVTKVVKKRRETLFTRALALHGAGPGGTGNTVTVNLAKPFKGMVKVTVQGTLQAANGASNAVVFTTVVP